MKFLALLFLVVPAVAAAGPLLERIAARGEIRIGVRHDAPPFSYMNSVEATGFTVELCARVVDTVFTPVPRIVAVEVDAASRFDALAEGRIDLLCGATTATMERESRAAFSIPIYETGVSALVAPDASDAMAAALLFGGLWEMTAAEVAEVFDGTTVVAHSGTTAEAWLRRDLAPLAPGARVEITDDHAIGVDAALSGKIDAYFADGAILAGQLDLRGAGRGRLSPIPVTYEPYALAMPLGDEDMVIQVNIALAAIFGTDGFRALYARYFGAMDDATAAFYTITDTDE